MRKTALILSGGGMKVSYISGAIKGLAEKGITDFDIIIAGSGASGIASYYVTHQLDYMERAWELIASRRFVSFARFWKIMDLDYLTKTVFAKKIPLNTEALKKAETELEIPAMNQATNEIKYFSNHSTENILEVLKATHSMPFILKPVKINDDLYHDSLETSYPWFHIKQARELGATHIVVINCLHDAPKKIYQIEEILFYFRKINFYKKHKYYHELMMNHLGTDGAKDIFYISPSKKTECGDFTRDPIRIKKTLELGRLDVLNSKVEEFLAS